MAKLDYFYIEELARAILKQDDSVDWDDLESMLFDKLDVDFDTFRKVVETLIDYTVPTESPLTGTIYQGFVDGNCYVCKQEVGNEQ